MDKLITNEEIFLNSILTGDTRNMPEPKTRVEVLLKKIAEKPSGGGGTGETLTKEEMLAILNGGDN